MKIKISQDQEPPEGWPRPPKFNEPGDVPGPPVQYGEPITNNNVKAGFNFIPNGVEEKNLYYYHPDHLGSSSYITDKNGEVIQHTEYIAFGEILVDEHSVSNKQPYLFNGKELDQETGLYYYGARYYDPRVSLWLNVDPLAEKYPEVSPYTYTLNNPIKFIDPDGRIVLDPGDRFKSLRAAAIDFGKQYNGLSIRKNIEIRTTFYKAIDNNGETYYSYYTPIAGNQAMVGSYSNNDMQEILKLGEVVADGHTHSADTDIINLGGKYYSNANSFSPQDISLYNNRLTDSEGRNIDNGYDKPVIGYIATPDGGLREYIPGVSNESYSEKKDAMGISIKNYDIPISTDLPSDPSSKSLRLNNIPPTNTPNILPKGMKKE